MSFISLSVLEVLIPRLNDRFSFQPESLALQKDHNHFRPCMILIPTNGNQRSKQDRKVVWGEALP